MPASNKKEIVISWLWNKIRCTGVKILKYYPVISKEPQKENVPLCFHYSLPAATQKWELLQRYEKRFCQSFPLQPGAHVMSKNGKKPADKWYG